MKFLADKTRLVFGPAGQTLFDGTNIVENQRQDSIFGQVNKLL
jgi:hypothetical protein